MTAALAPLFPDNPPPEGWTDRYFGENGELCGGFAFPPGAINGAVVLLVGRSEPREKYFEVIRDLHKRGLAVFIYDTRGQGRSQRYLSNREKGHSGPFEQHVDDLETFLRDVVTPEMKARGLDNKPLIALSHSTGGNILLRGLPGRLQTAFTAAVFGSPMTGLKAIPTWLCHLKPLLNPFREMYLPAILTGMNDWNEAASRKSATSLTSDEKRGRIQPDVMKADPDLRHGGPTVGWILEALTSCWHLATRTPVKDIKIPTLFIVGGADDLVDNRATEKIALRIDGSILNRIDGAKHEIMMERDELRDQFWAHFDAFLTKIGVLQSTAESRKPAIS